MTNKYLTESGWKAVLTKSKVADNGLGKALAGYEKLAVDKYERRLEALGEVSALSTKMKSVMTDGLKTAKANKAKPEVSKNLEEVLKYLAEVDKALAAEKKDVEAAETKAIAAVKAAQPPMLDRLVDAAATLSGPEGNRVRKVMAIAKAKGGSWQQVWFYNYSTVAEYVKYNQKQSVRESMAKEGGGKLPFKGKTWVVLPFVDSLNNICKKGCPDKDLVTFLKWMDGQILHSVDLMSKVQATEVASAFGPSVNEFIKHVGKLAGDKTSVYSAGY